jgi:hypothetical protein
MHIPASKIGGHSCLSVRADTFANELPAVTACPVWREEPIDAANETSVVQSQPSSPNVLGDF